MNRSFSLMILVAFGVLAAQAVSAEAKGVKTQTGNRQSAGPKMTTRNFANGSGKNIDPGYGKTVHQVPGKINSVKNLGTSKVNQVPVTFGGNPPKSPSTPVTFGGNPPRGPSHDCDHGHDCDHHHDCDRSCRHDCDYHCEHGRGECGQYCEGRHDCRRFCDWMFFAENCGRNCTGDCSDDSCGDTCEQPCDDCDYGICP